MKYELYEVGGKIRDEFLGLKSKDVDYSVVILDELTDKSLPLLAFENFVYQIETEGFEVFLKTPDCFTVRAMFPKDHKYSGVADFVLARKELGYIPNTRTPKVELGTLRDDLERRDFTVNALAKDSDGNIVDYFGGQKDLLSGILRTPVDTAVSFNDDPLRILRAMRFMVTKGFAVSDNIIETIETFNSAKMEVVSTERIREELHKMFHYNTKRTMQILYWLNQINPELHSNIFSRDLWLMPTNKK